MATTFSFCTSQRSCEALKGDEACLLKNSQEKESYEKRSANAAVSECDRQPFEPENGSKRRIADRLLPFRRRIGSRLELRSVKGYAGHWDGWRALRVLTDISESDSVQTGDILVTTATNIGWVKVFPKLSAIVTDIGAPLSHAAIVARELGIPAVVGCGNATTVIRSGDRILVDGTQGYVSHIEKRS